ncbi:MAG: CapA family protein [Nodosilinea sp.]
MISAVVPPQPRLISLEPLPQPPTVRERAAAGYFRDIALWLNQPLAAHGIFVQVQADRPGCLRLVVEFQQPPIKDRLLRFLCHRMWLLNSELIEGICVVARPLGNRRVLWQQRIKIVTPALKRHQAELKAKAERDKTSPMPAQIRPARPAKRLSRQHLQTLRTFVLSGSAVAAFVMGCLLEMILATPSPTLPQFSAQSEVRMAEESARETYARSPETNTEEATTALVKSPPARTGSRGSTAGSTPTGSGAHRPTVVDAALEPVGVITHPTLTPASDDDVTLLFGGDISLDDVAPDALTAPGGFFADVTDYGEADLALVNLATPLATAATNLQEGLRHQTRTDAVNLLVDSGVDIVNLTHSRLMDYGAAGLDETLTTLDSKGLYRIGAGRNALEARRPEVIDVKGKRIAYLSYAMGGSDAAHDTAVLKERAGAEDEAIAKEVETFKTATAFEDRAGFNAQNMPEIVADIQALRNEVDWIVVNFRWVDHLGEQPNFMQTNLARLAIDQGADVVVGYHPTVIQGGEIYKGRPIAYSLGDFVFHPDEPVENQDSAVLKVSLKDDQMQVELVPVRVRDSRPKTLTGNASQGVLQRIEQASSQFNQPLQSPVVLDLKAPEVSPETVSDPSSPFVSPEAEDVLPVELEPKPEPEFKQAPNQEPTYQETEPGSEALTEPENFDSLTKPEDKLNKPSLPLIPIPAPEASDEPTTAPEIEVEFNEDLLEWGPKVSPKQREFQPVPTQRSGDSSTDSEVSAPQPNLGHEEPVAILTSPPKVQAKSLDVLGEVSGWADTVPDSPVPLAPAAE